MSPGFGAGRTRLLSLALLVVTFVAGALAGAAVDRVLSADEADREERTRARDGDRRSYVIDQVEMDEGQRRDIDAILQRRAKRMRAVWQEVSPRLETITDSARLEIMEVLTPEQRAEYERRLSEREAAREARHREEGRDDEGPTTSPDSAASPDGGAPRPDGSPEGGR